MTNKFNKLMITAMLMTACGVAQDAVAQTEAKEIDESPSVAASSKQYVLELAAPNPVLRLRAAENLARITSIEDKRVVEGYRLQEKDKRVQLALDWALYRFGDDTKLFRIVSALDSTLYRSQATSYLSQLDTPEPLYMFLNTPKRNVRVGVLDALGNVGDAGTFPQLEPLTRASDKRIAIAANAAAKRITERLEEDAMDAQDVSPTRPRQTGTRREKDEPPSDDPF